MLANMTAAIVAALQAQNTPEGGTGRHNQDKPGEDYRPHSKFQLAKLKGFCCMWTNADPPPIWGYFKSTKDVDTQWTQLLEDMMTWAKQQDVQINRGLYFNKATKYDIVKWEFCPVTPTAFWNTAEQGISLLICSPRQGNETSDICLKEQALQLTQQNHTLTEALFLSKRDPQPDTTRHKLSRAQTWHWVVLHAPMGPVWWKM